MKLTLENKRNLLVIGVTLASIGYLFSTKTTSIGVILFLTTWVLNFKEVSFSSFLKKNTLHLLIVFFVFLLIGVTYSLDLQQAQKDIVRHLSFVLLPLMFLTIKSFNKREYNFVIKIYVYAITFFFIICLSNAIFRQVIFSKHGGIFNWYFFYRYDFLEIFRQHPTHVSMYVLLSLSFLFEKGKTLFKNKRVLFSIILIQGLSIVLYGSRIGYVIFFLVLIIYMFKSLKSKTKKRNLGLIYIVSIVILLISSWNIPIVKERIQFTFGYQQDYKFNNQETIKNHTPVELGRLLLWKDAFELIKKKPFFGYGTGPNYVVLNQKYKEKGHQLFLEKRYNVHNTYSDLFLTGGIPLLLVYLSLLGSLLYKGIIKKNYILLSFFLIIAITGLTETIFRAQGIVFFAFFYCFLLSTKEYNE